MADETRLESLLESPSTPQEGGSLTPSSQGGVAVRAEKKGTLIYDIDLGWYLKEVRSPLFIAGGIIIVMTLSALIVPNVWADAADASTFVAKLCLFAWVGRQFAVKRAVSAKVAAIGAACAGFALGLALAFVRFFVVREVWTLFNFTMEPVLTALFGYCIGGIVALASKSHPRYTEIVEG
ncbi:MAG: hypothetical protein AB1352_01075 [Patescibacteria group bacterium]